MATESERIIIPAPDLRVLEVTIDGTAPLMVNKFPEKARGLMRDKQAAGSRAKKGTAKAARNFDADFEAARYKSAEGWDGINAAAFRNAMISACRLVNFKMTLAKLSVFILHDGLDVEEGTPLVKII